MNKLESLHIQDEKASVNRAFIEHVFSDNSDLDREKQDEPKNLN